MNGAKCTWSLSQHQENGEWRFTSDLEGWPITLIRPLFQRLGERKPKYFGKLDLTAGYHQAPLDEASRVYTAFRTIHGLYEWTRVPMRTKGSGVIATQVLDGVIATLPDRRCTDRWRRRT